MTTLSVVRLGVVDLHAAGLGVEEDAARRWPGAPPTPGRGRGSSTASAAVAGRRTARNPAAATRSISATASSTSVSGTGAVGASRSKYGAEPLDDVVVVDPGVGHRQLVVVGVEAEQRQVRVHHLDVDAVEVHVLEDELGVALGRAPAASGGSGRPSSPRSRACAACGRPGRRPRRAARSRSPPPRPPRSRRCFGRRVLNRSMGSRRCPSAETTKSFSVIACDTKPTGRYKQCADA